MLGAILGDIVGSPYEFDHNNYKHKDFPLLSEKSHFTDDTVMTAAVAVGLIDGKGLPERTFCAVQHEMRFWGREYPHAGYGGMFRRWLHAENPKPYGSFGNGSAMRVSAAGWLFDTLDKTLEMAKVTAEVTHNHPEGIKGAQATAAAIFPARSADRSPHGDSPDEFHRRCGSNRSRRSAPHTAGSPACCGRCVPERSLPPWPVRP